MNSLPSPSTVLDLIEAFRRSKTMFAATELGIFDLLEKSPASAAELALHSETQVEPLERLLDGCVGLGLLTREGALYANTPAASTYLTRSSERSMAGYVLYSNRALFPMWQHLEEALREAAPRWGQTFGMPGPIFTAFFRTDESMREFIDGMNGFGRMSSPTIARTFDLSRFRRAVDLGGATGHLVLELCKMYPEMEGAVLDLPQVTRVAREHVAASPVRDRVSVIDGDFFTDMLPPADLYLLGRILHDWSEPKIRSLLARLYEALPEGGAVLVAEKLLDDDKRGPVEAQMQSLNMLICTEGRERTVAEYRALFREAGFREVEGRRTGTPLDAVLAIK